MVDFNVAIANGVDDYFCKIGGASFDNSGTQLILGDISGDNYLSGFVFQNVTIPQGAEILTAYIQLRAWGSRSATTCNLKIHCEDEDTATIPSSGSEADGLSLTTGTAWSGVPAWTGGVDYDSPDFAADLQTVVNRGGWSSGNRVGVVLRDNSSSTGAFRDVQSYEHAGAYQAVLYVTYSLAGDIADDLTIADEADAFNLTDDVSENLTISDEIIAAGGSVSISTEPEQMVIDDAVNAGLDYLVDIPDALTIADTVTVGLEYDSDIPDAFNIADLTDCLNWSQFLRDNQNLYVLRYYFTLTGAADGTSDIEIPVSSIQARKRSGYSTQLSVVIQDYLTWAAAVSARPNGSMYIDMAYLVDGVEQLRERILIVDLDDIRLDKGSRSRAITLTGTRVQTFGAQVVAVPDPSYRYLIDGKISYRFPVPDPWLDPGNTCVVGDDEFTVDWVNYVITENYRSMEVREV